VGENAGPDGITAVRLKSGLAFFADAVACPSAVPSDELARSALTAIGGLLGRPVVLLHADQRHTALTFTFGAEGSLAREPHSVGVCDALITAEPNVALLVRTADCLPVALAGEGVVAIVHAGWRGLAADILGATTRRLRAEFGVEPTALEAVVGIGIGPCHYRVGGEVRAALSEHATVAGNWSREDRVDLAGFARGRLRALGLRAGAVTCLSGCTACSPRHHSYRRDGTDAGRQWSAVIRPEA
jgi:purine-nucleoside/S-methyl-5'-thioadenosine phosphorylase / adenosine deaminase